MRKVLLKDLTPEEIIKRLRKGEVIKCEDSNKITYLIDGIIVSEELLLVNGENVKNLIFGSHFFVSYKVDYLYFEEEEPFKITETGVYKTRDGRKAFVYEIDDETDDIYPINYILENLTSSKSVTRQGRTNTFEKTKNDIVAKWED